MINFLKASLREFKHVVWPTRKETKKHFFTVIIILVLFWLYLSFFDLLFSESIFTLRDYINR